MGRVVQNKLKASVNVPPDDWAQYTGAVGAAVMAQRRLKKIKSGNGNGKGEREFEVVSEEVVDA